MAFNENSRVKIPTILHLVRLGYEYLSLKGQTWDETTNIFTEIFNKNIKEKRKNNKSRYSSNSDQLNTKNLDGIKK